MRLVFLTTWSGSAKKVESHLMLLLTMVRNTTYCQNVYLKHMRLVSLTTCSGSVKRKKLPDAGHGENENKEPELPLPEHEASLRGLAGPV
jgi:hypothetical protein